MYVFMFLIIVRLLEPNILVLVSSTLRFLKVTLIAMLTTTRAYNSVSNPSSEGIGPVKALSPKVKTIVEANECIFVAQVNKVE